MMKYAVIVLMIWCLNWNIPSSYAQNEEYGLSAMMFDFDRDFANWNPLKKELSFPSGISFIYSRQVTRYLSYTLPIHVGKETNLLNSDGNSSNINVMSGDLAIKLEQLGSWNILSPYLLTGIGGYASNEDGEGLQIRAKVPIGLGLNIKLYKRLYLRLHSSYNREIKRNRAYYIYGAGLNVKLGKDPIRRKSDKDLEPILLASDENKMLDTDEDGVPDSLDMCPLEAGILANNGCPLYTDSNDSDQDSLNVFREAVTDNGNEIEITVEDSIFVDEDLMVINDIELEIDTNKSDSLESDITLLDTNDSISVVSLIDSTDKLNTDITAVDVVNQDDENPELIVEATERQVEELKEKDVIITKETIIDSSELVTAEDIAIVQPELDDSVVVNIITQNNLSDDKDIVVDSSSITEIEIQENPDLVINNEEKKEENTTVEDNELAAKKDGSEDVEIVNNRSERDTIYIRDTITQISYIKMNDKDDDGIADDIDRCPDQKGVIQNSGCPENEESDLATTEVENAVAKESPLNVNNSSDKDFINLEKEIGQLRFPTGIAALQEGHINVLNNVLKILKANPNMRLKIYGHTDNEGSVGLNNVLSINRAKACYEYLNIFHVPMSQMTYEGKGEASPIEKNDTYIGRSKNRRVAFEFHTL